MTIIFHSSLNTIDHRKQSLLWYILSNLFVDGRLLWIFFEANILRKSLEIFFWRWFFRWALSTILIALGIKFFLCFWRCFYLDNDFDLSICNICKIIHISRISFLRYPWVLILIFSVYQKTDYYKLVSF